MRRCVAQKLIEFAELGNIPKIEELITAGADVDALDEHGYSALHYCVMKRFVSCAMILIEAQASIDLGSKYSQSALYLSARAGDLYMVKLLISKGADVNKTNGPAGYTTMFAAVISDSVDIIRELIKNGADVNAIASNLETPLWTAAFLGKSDCIRVLTENGADVSIQAHWLPPLKILCECTTVDWFGDTCSKEACKHQKQMKSMLA